VIGDMSHVTLNFDVSKIPFVHSSQGQNLYSHQKLNMYIYWFSSESSYRRRWRWQCRTPQYNHYVDISPIKMFCNFIIWIQYSIIVIY